MKLTSIAIHPLHRSGWPWLSSHLARLPLQAARWALARPALAVACFGCLLFVPALGSVGLWDPWETHYSEVAREMLTRHDFVFPHWGDAYFFSKPVLTLWLIALGLFVVGAESAPVGAALPSGVEWGVRIPFALLAILTLLAVNRLGRQLAGRRAGLLSAFVLGTSPLMIFVGKQAMTDLPLVACTFIGLAFTLPVAFPPSGRGDPSSAPRWERGLVAGGVLLLVITQVVLVASNVAIGWVRALVLGLLLPLAGVVVSIARSQDRGKVELAIAGVAFGLAVLAKGLEVAALIGPAFLLTALLTWDLSPLRRSRPLWVIAIAVLVALPWYLALLTFAGRDDEGLTFLSRFIGHDHFARVFSGVHGDRGGAEYYAKQLLVGFFPWVCFLPMAWLGVGAKHAPEGSRAASFFVQVFGAFVYAFLTASATKFHHYIFPALPAFALTLGAYGRRLNLSLLGSGATLMVLTIFLVGLRDMVENPASLVHLFTYKYDREFPPEALVRPFVLGIFGGGAILVAIAWRTARRRWAMGTFASSAFAFAVFCSHFHFNMMSPHYSQAHLFQTYFEERRGTEPVLAYQLNWRGEMFYSRGKTQEIMNAGAADRLRQLVTRPGRHFVLLERSRLSELRGLLPGSLSERLEIVDRSNAHFYLCQVETP